MKGQLDTLQGTEIMGEDPLDHLKDGRVHQSI